MKNLQSLRLLLADKDKEIEELKKELTEEKNAYIKMYNMYDEEKKKNEKAIEYIMSNLIDEYDIRNNGCVSGSDLPVDAITPILEILKGEDKE